MRMQRIWCPSVQGESHKATDKVCQDCSSVVLESDIAIAVVSDGHGGERYFRSDFGSQKAVEITQDSLLAAAKTWDASLLSRTPFTDVPKGDLQRDTPQKEYLRQLLGAMIFNWRKAIQEHALNTPLTEEEKNKLPEKYQTSFETAKDAEDFAPFYGATLMAYLETPDYWLAFHIGDGKLVTLEQDVNGKLLFREPVPADEDCFLNKTTSLCDSNAFNEIRCCFGGRETHPLAVFLCSDGIEDSWGANLNLYSYYARFLKQLKTKTADEISNGLPIELAELSRRGSGDDMSLACLYDETQHDLLYRLILEWQIDAVQEQLQKLDSPNSTQPDFNSLEADIAAAKSVEDALEKKRGSISERIEEINRHRNVINNKIENKKGNFLLLKPQREAFIAIFWQCSVTSSHQETMNLTS